MERIFTAAEINDALRRLLGADGTAADTYAGLVQLLSAGKARVAGIRDGEFLWEHTDRAVNS